MARLPQLVKVAEKHNLKIISIEDLVAYRMRHDSLIVKKEDFSIDTDYGQFRLRAYEQTTNGQIHLAFTKGTWAKDEPVLTRIHANFISNDILDLLCKKDNELNRIFQQIDAAGKGAFIVINQASPFASAFFSGEGYRNRCSDPYRSRYLSYETPYQL